MAFTYLVHKRQLDFKSISIEQTGQTVKFYYAKKMPINQQKTI